MKLRIQFPTLLLALALIPPGAVRGGTAKPALPLDGILTQTSHGPALSVSGREYPLSTVRTWHFNTLKDKRLDGREIRVEGQWASDGTLKVSQFYTIKGGKLYRVRYYCDVCNIEALEPGTCVCCQQPTELQEIPVNAKP